MSVVFSELLKRDDGVLRDLLRAEGLGELEAAGEIDRFVFEVRHAIEHGKPYELVGFGVLKPGPNATIAFEYRPAPVAAAVKTPAEASQRRTEKSDGRTEGAASGQSGADPGDALHGVQGADGANPIRPAGPGGQPEPDAGAKAPAAGRSAIRPDRVAEAVETAFADPCVSPSVKMNPEPYVRGLKYGKPHKTTDAYRYVDRAPRRRFDRFLWVAIIAAALAVAAIAFGYWRELQEREAEAEQTEQTGQTEQTEPTEATGVDRTDRRASASDPLTDVKSASGESALHVAQNASAAQTPAVTEPAGQTLANTEPAVTQPAGQTLADARSAGDPAAQPSSEAQTAPAARSATRPEAQTASAARPATRSAAGPESGPETAAGATNPNQTDQ